MIDDSPFGFLVEKCEKQRNQWAKKADAKNLNLKFKVTHKPACLHMYSEMFSLICHQFKCFQYIFNLAAQRRSTRLVCYNNWFLISHSVRTICLLISKEFDICTKEDEKKKLCVIGGEIYIEKYGPVQKSCYIKLFCFPLRLWLRIKFIDNKLYYYGLKMLLFFILTFFL